MMKMLRFLVAFSCLFMSFAAIGQVRLGVFGGMANYQGDLTDRVFAQPKVAAGLTLAYELTNRISIRAGLTFAKVTSADSLNKSSLRARNLSFQSPITEFSVVGEFNTFDLDTKRWSPYLMGGVAVFHFNPYTNDAAGTKVYLQPLRTEGQGTAGYPLKKPYSLTQFAIPIGGGVKYNLTENIRISLETGLRILFTDYLDDVSGNYADASDLFAVTGQRAVDLAYRGDEVPGGNPVYPAKGDQRGSPKYKDFYYFTGLHLSFRLPEGKSGRTDRAARRGQYGCPVF